MLIRHFTIKQRLVALVAGAVVAIAALAGTSVYLQYMAMSDAAELAHMVAETRQAQVAYKVQMQEWKNTLLRGNNQADFDKYWGKVQEGSTEIVAELEDIRNNYVTMGMDPSLVDETIREYRNMMTAYADALKLYDIGDFTSAQTVDKAVRGVDRKANDNLDQIVTDFNQHAAFKTQQQLRQVVALMAGVCVLLSVLFILSALFTVRSITRPIAGMVDELVKLAQYRLNSRVDELGQDEITHMSREYNRFVANLRQIVGSVGSVSSDIASATHELSSSTSTMSQMVDVQRRSLEQIAAAIEESSATVHEINRMSTNTSESVGHISHAAQTADGAMKMLRTKSEEIVKVTSVIQDITDQINLLALNAAIEAARAGDAGRGFAVVADEVRKLATSTSESTKQITDVIGSLRDNVQHTGAALDEITGSLGKISDDVKNVSLSLSQQSTATEEIAATVQEFSNNMDEVARNVAQTDQATQEIAQQATVLDGEMRKFTL